jgi:predicted nucleic acid-binding protein
MGRPRRPRRSPLRRRSHVPLIGTLGVVLRAKKTRQVEHARPLVKELIAAGMFLDDEFAERALASIDE